MPRRPSASRLAALAGLVTITLTLSACITPNSRWVTPTSGRIGGSSAPPSAGPSGFPVTPIEWRPCPEVSREVLGRTMPNVTYDCGALNVPQDWNVVKAGQPVAGKTFEIALVRGRASGQRDRIGSLLVNPGGPGGSGYDYGVYAAATLPAEITRRFDVIGFDPRGVGRSEGVKCFSDADLDATFGAEPDPVGQVEFDAYTALSRRMAQSCGTKYAETLNLFSTVQAAHDIDAIRAAVGDAKTTYLGYSYGTLLGATYAQLYPQNVRALVLDGAIDPTLTSEASTESQTKGFERAFDNFAGWCRSNAGQCPIAPDARAAVMQAMATARTNPVRHSDGRSVTSGWIFTAVIASLYDEADWRRLASAVNDLRSGRGAPILQLADGYTSRDSSGRYSNLFDANLTVNCTDSDDSPSVERSRQLQSEWRTKYPLFGANSALGLICAQWPGKRDPYPAGAATGAPPIVVVGTTGDPATPYEQTPALAKMLGVGVVVTWQGEGHTAYPQTACVSDAVNRYFIDLKVPADGLTCPR